LDLGLVGGANFLWKRCPGSPLEISPMRAPFAKRRNNWEGTGTTRILL